MQRRFPEAHGPLREPKLHRHQAYAEARPGSRPEPFRAKTRISSEEEFHHGLSSSFSKPSLPLQGDNSRGSRLIGSSLQSQNPYLNSQLHGIVFITRPQLREPFGPTKPVPHPALPNRLTYNYSFSLARHTGT
ncbi:hypothetical protein MC885_019647 [Smutsia gigantea]|nr:hypothetical protein MC885_019647 [Smutsia gigantea]